MAVQPDVVTTPVVPADGAPEPAAAVVVASAESVQPTESGDAQSSPDAPPKKKVNILGFQIAASEHGARRAFVGAGCFLIFLNGLGMPFVLPKLRHFLGAPYVPMKRPIVESLFDRVLPTWAANSGRGAEGARGPLAGLRLVDFGSGDGRIVAAAAGRGMQAVGYELNPYLVWLSRLRNRSAIAASPGTAEFKWANAWAADLRRTDVVTLYGRPGDGLMERAAAKCEAELPHHAVVVSHYFPMPGWERLLVQDVDGLKLYDMSRRLAASKTE